MAGALVAVGSANAADPAEPTDAVRLREMQQMLDRIHSNELRRLRLDLDVERLRADKERLDADRTIWQDEQARLEREITNLQARVAAAERPVPKPGLFVSLGDATLRRGDGPPVEVPPMTVVEVTGATNARLQVVHSGAAYDADPSDFSAEPELLAHLEARARRHAAELALAQAEVAKLDREAASAGAAPDAADRARAAKEKSDELDRQMRRVRTAIEHVKKALAAHRAGGTAPKGQP